MKSMIGHIYGRENLLNSLERPHMFVNELELNVYQENESSVAFYKANGFEILKESLDSNTQAKEFVMLWKSTL